MPFKPKPGEYRHSAAPLMQAGPDGSFRPVRTRRRFPHHGAVFMFSGLLGPLLCAGVSLLFRLGGHPEALPQIGAGHAGRAPSLTNVIFGIGVYELVLGCAFYGLLLWRYLWNARVPQDVHEGGFRARAAALLPQGLFLGVVLLFVPAVISITGLHIRDASPTEPLFIRPFLGLLFAAPAIGLSALLTGVIPALLTLLGLIGGAGTAVAVALLWPEYPEEPVFK